MSLGAIGLTDSLYSLFPRATGKDFLAGVKSIRVTLKRALITGPKPNKLMISSAPRPFANLSSWG